MSQTSAHPAHTLYCYQLLHCALSTLSNHFMVIYGVPLEEPLLTFTPLHLRIIAYLQQEYHNAINLKYLIGD